MRDMVEIEIDAAGVAVSASAAPVARGQARRARRRVTVNRAESPLGWLAARGLVDARQVEAGGRLRCDYETAQLGARVTMQWDSVRVDGGGGGALELGLAQIAAKRRFDAAVNAVGRGLNDVLWRVVCAGEAITVAERALGWPGRAGRLVLGIALDRLADHYRLP
ncbi:DUF6456 domain-containing protein [Sphingomonas sp.]|jgi:hypothetical protein|uniref:DUF6456 domain-containing protein n=1 Tax=Sphingomonas sp. TaxID=28214 RepID=UPI002E32327F|nr:DUF6456 domain-containing protein [Sphingomonas sp.]HEX4695689.1 DUF6456 domain-containing protein [Sphingomonas sp.]